MNYDVLPAAYELLKDDVYYHSFVCLQSKS